MHGTQFSVQAEAKLFFSSTSERLHY